MNAEIDDLIDDLEFDAECDRLEKKVCEYREKHGLIDIESIKPVYISEQFIRDSREKTLRFLCDKYGKVVCNKLFGDINSL